MSHIDFTNVYIIACCIALVALFLWTWKDDQ